MRFHLATLCLALFSSLALAAGSTPTEEMKPYVVSYPSDTPMKVMDDTMDEIVKAGGTITHKYHLVMGFAAKAPPEVMQTVKTEGKGNDVVVEYDQPMGINGDSS